MTQTGYSSALVNLTLGWLKGLASWVLKLFNLAGSGGSPLLWLSQNWLKLLVFCLILGVVVDWLVWMIRWRPYWVWFRKKRIVVNDERFFSGKNDDVDMDDDEFDHRYVVPSTVVSHRPAGGQRTTAKKRTTAVPRQVQKRRVDATVARPSRGQASKQVRSPRRMPVRSAVPDELFEVGHTQQEYSDFFEDEVFNVSSLPDRSDGMKRNRKRRR